MVCYNFNTCLGYKEQLLEENQELKKQCEEEECQVSALKSQYEDRLSWQKRALRDLRSQLERQKQRNEPPESGPSRVKVMPTTQGESRAGEFNSSDIRRKQVCYFYHEHFYVICVLKCSLQPIKPHLTHIAHNL